MATTNRVAEKLPPGFHRAQAGSLRVQIRIKGHRRAVRTFPLFENTSDARKRQKDDAQSWAVETRRRMRAGTHADTREAEVTTLGAVLRRYEAVGLKGKDSNAAKDRARIRQILDDPIALRPVIGLKKSDIAAYRDELVERGWRKNIDAAIGRLANASGQHAPKRILDLKNLPALVAEAVLAAPAMRRSMQAEISAIEDRERISKPARTTISNKIQLITRSLKLAAETMQGVPDLKGVPMPSASAGRDRRLTKRELDNLLDMGSRYHPLMPCQTALKKDPGSALKKDPSLAGPRR